MLESATYASLGTALWVLLVGRQRATCMAVPGKPCSLARLALSSLGRWKSAVRGCQELHWQVGLLAPQVLQFFSLPSCLSCMRNWHGCRVNKLQGNRAFLYCTCSNS